jgi:endogenous inhibitor of DNA gyrase (YacG/DUF329 family)
MSLTVNISCPDCGRELVAEPGSGGENRERLFGRVVNCARCGRRVDLYYY